MALWMNLARFAGVEAIVEKMNLVESNRLTDEGVEFECEIDSREKRVRERVCVTKKVTHSSNHRSK